jgi:hypothetical protein
MPTDWKRADDDELRAHLQAAIAERGVRDAAEDWRYSGYELAAIREELRHRRVARAAGAGVAERTDARGSKHRLAA